MVDAKLVRTYAKAGQVANFVAITGNNHRYQWMSISIIKQMLERGVRVYEKLEDGIELEDGSTEIELTLGDEDAGIAANYDADTGGVPFDAEDKSIVVVQNLEEQRIEELNTIKEQHLADIGMKIKEHMDEVYQEEDNDVNDDNTTTSNDNTYAGDDNTTTDDDNTYAGDDNTTTDDDNTYVDDDI